MDSNNNFEVGDIVHLKSGSARLTVVGTHQNEFRQVTEVDIAWMYFETQELRQARLPASALRPAEEKPEYTRVRPDGYMRGSDNTDQYERMR